jgi:hypothetical protein
VVGGGVNCLELKVEVAIIALVGAAGGSALSERHVQLIPAKLELQHRDRASQSTPPQASIGDRLHKPSPPNFLSPSRLRTRTYRHVWRR